MAQDGKIKNAPPPPRKPRKPIAGMLDNLLDNFRAVLQKEAKLLHEVRTSCPSYKRSIGADYKAKSSQTSADMRAALY